MNTEAENSAGIQAGIIRRQLSKVPASMRRTYLKSLIEYRERLRTNYKGKLARVYAVMPTAHMADKPRARLFSVVVGLPEDELVQVPRRVYAFHSLLARREFLASNPEAVRCPQPEALLSVPEEKLEAYLQRLDQQRQRRAA